MKKLSCSVALLALAAACPVDKPTGADAAKDAGAVTTTPDGPATPSPAATSAIAALPMGSPVLIIDGVIYSRADLERAILQHAASAGLPPESVDGELRTALEQPAYEKLVDRHVMSAEAKRRGLWPSDETVAAEKAKIMDSIPSGMTPETFLQSLHTDDAGLGKEVATDLALSKLFEAMNKEQKTPDEATLRKIYDENKAAFMTRELGSASHIFIELPPGSSPEKTAAAQKRADELRAKVLGKDKETFAKVAVESSDDPNAKKNRGDLGSFPRGAMVSQLDEVAFRLKEGEVSEVVRSDFGLHIVRGQGIKKSVQRTFEEVKPLIVDRERGRLFMSGLDAFLAGLRQKANIQRVVEPAKSILPPELGGSGPGGPGGMASPPPGLSLPPPSAPPGPPPAPSPPSAPVPPGGAAG